jgi:PTH1 family peptidyl-tRNA hydrolase
MNCSGQAVGLIARYYKINPDEILVIHDELDFEAGKVKIKKNGGHAGHNGLRDIIAHLDSHAFYRLRIGIGRPMAGKSVADYVLSIPSKEEMEKITDVIVDGERLIDNLMSEIKN